MADSRVRRLTTVAHLALMRRLEQMDVVLTRDDPPLPPPPPYDWAKDEEP